jgi:hypothetical protein
VKNRTSFLSCASFLADTVGERAAAPADQRNLTVTVSIAGTTMCRLKWFMALFTMICHSQEVGQVSNQTALQENEEGVIQRDRRSQQ